MCIAIELYLTHCFLLSKDCSYAWHALSFLILTPLPKLWPQDSASLQNPLSPLHKVEESEAGRLN